MTEKYRPGQDLQMMQDPDEWPLWPQLPLKRRSEYSHDGIRSGFLVAIPTLRPVVYLGPVGTVVENRKTIEYSNFGELLEDGWVVD